MFKKIIFIVSFIILMFEYSFPAAEVNPIMDTNSDILYESNTAIHPVIRQIVDSYIRYNTEARPMKEAAIITGNSGFDQLSAGLSEGFFTPANTVQSQSSDYFPLYPGTVWEYLENGNSKYISKVLPKLVKVNGVVTSVVLCGCGQKEYYTSDSNGVMLHRLFIPNVFIPRIGQVNLSTTFIPPLKMADGVISIGQTINTSGIVRYNNLPVIGTIKLPYDADFTFASMENVSVPAGDFEVLKITGSLTINSQSTSYTFYLAKDTGIVKTVSDGDTQELTAVYYVELSSPSEEEIIPSGNIYTITWKATQDTAYFKLLYSKDSGTTWTSITPDLRTGTSFDWNVPSPKNNKTACLIKIIGYDSDVVEKTSVISKPFTIEVVKLTSPDGGETLTSNSSWPITWNTNVTNTPVAKVILKYTINGGTTWKTITKITGSNPGTYDWNIPVVSRETTKCKVKIILQNANGKVVGTDMSDAYFTISP